MPFESRRPLQCRSARAFVQAAYRACASLAGQMIEALEQRELLSAQPLSSAAAAVTSRHHAHHVHHIHHLRQMNQMAAQASVTTNKLDYRPGERAAVTGAGFLPAEQVRLQVLHTDGTSNAAASHQPWAVRADARGGFSTSYLVGQDDLNASMRLTAVGLTSGRTAQEDFSDSSSIVRPDHIVIVIEEDRASDAIGDLVHMPYFNQLAASGLVYANSHGVAHPSLPDYLALFSGSTQGITDNGNTHTFTAPNLASLFNSTQIAAGQYLSFGGFAESLPHDGDTTTRIAGDPNDPSAPPDLYMRNYNPMAQFTNVGVRSGVALTNAQVNKTFASFPTTAAGYAALPTVSFVIPNTLHNTHGSNEQPPYATDPSEYNFLRSSADTWLHDKLDGYLQWARQNNSLLIVTGDEEETDSHTTEEITTIVNGDPDLFVPGTNNNSVNHFNLVRTITDMYGLTPLADAADYDHLDTDALGRLSNGVAATAPSTTVLNANPGTSLFGQSVTFTATVSGTAGTASGTVTFKDGASVLGTGNLNASGVATISISALGAGTHSITAVYGGDAAYGSSMSAGVDYQVAKATTSATLTSAPNPTLFGQAVTLTATLTSVAPGAGVPTGNVTFMDGATAIGTAALNGSGVATLNTGALAVGSHSITAVYAGSANFSSGTSNVLAHVVNQANSAISVTASSNPATVNQSVNFTANVAAVSPGSGIPSGTVQFLVDGINFGNPVALVNGVATSAATSWPAAATHTISAAYAGSASYAAIASSGLVLTVSALNNDNFANRTVLNGTSISVTGNNATATKESGEPNHAGNVGGKSLWWSWTAPSSGQAIIDTAGSSFDTLLAAYTGTSVSALTAVASNDDVSGTVSTSKISFNVTAGKVYQIAVDGYGGASGNISLHINTTVGVPAAPTGVAASDSTYGDKIRVTWTAPAGATSYEVWRATTNSSGSAARIATGVATTTFDDTTATVGTSYYYWIKATNAGGTSGFSTSDVGKRALANDAFASRIVLSGTSITASGSNVGATKETGEPKHGGNAGGKSVWWSWTAPASGKVTIDTSGSNFDTLLGVYTGTSVSALKSIASNDDSPSGGTATSKVTFTATAGAVYQIAVDGYGGASGNITLHISLA